MSDSALVGLEPVICTVSGKQVDLYDPDISQFCVEDIAYSLSNTNRFNGHARPPFSVAEHSVWVSWQFDVGTHPELALWGLMHDAVEAYIGDIVRPLKDQPEMEAFRRLESSLEAAIAEWLQVKLTCREILLLRLADNSLAVAEINKFMPHEKRRAGALVSREVLECEYESDLLELLSLGAYWEVDVLPLKDPEQEFLGRYLECVQALYLKTGWSGGEYLLPETRTS